MSELPTDYQKFIHKSRYARWIDEENRRETWNETVSRFFNFMVEHVKYTTDVDLSKNDTIKQVRQAILQLHVMPSMRSLMTAGPALKRENIAGYNCSYIPIDNPKSFDEYFDIVAGVVVFNPVTLLAGSKVIPSCNFAIFVIGHL